MVTDRNGAIVPTATHTISFGIEGPAEIVATDNGDPASLVSFASTRRDAYAGMALCIVRAAKGAAGSIKIKASVAGMPDAVIELPLK